MKDPRACMQMNVKGKMQTKVGRVFEASRLLLQFSKLR